MELQTTKTIFDAQVFTILWSKVIGLNFITITKDKFGNYHSETKCWDFVRFIMWIFLSFSVTMDNLRIPSDISSKRAFLDEFLIATNGKVGVTRSCFELVYAFCFRHEFFEILRDIKWIDDQVKTFKILFYKMFILFIFILSSHI